MRRTRARRAYEYDFGDGWDHLIEVEDELRVETIAMPLPIVLPAGARPHPETEVVRADTRTCCECSAQRFL
ncbi:MAG: IS1096 element passenger TnpR family protein [Candidatus Dormibacteraceae bacterium]